MQAALAAGRYIPHLCYHPEFTPHGSCKVCTVKVERPHDGRRAPRPAAGATEVESDTEELERAAPHAGADAVRRGQPLLPVLREERRLQAAGARPTISG
ncbi:MAG: 2Fe-2S iron-sulfur cluster-binding protein [Desulfobacterales bacterium]|nr:2Fe-2S iron-sulfur cluster-binding protein [Desulfobacterales bacterium]